MRRCVKNATSIGEMSIKSDQLGVKAVEATRTYLQRYERGTPSVIDAALVVSSGVECADEDRYFIRETEHRERLAWDGSDQES